MGAIRAAFATAFPDLTAGLPAKPSKSVIRSAGAVIEDEVEALREEVQLAAAANAAGTVIFETQASMTLGYAENTKAEVYADPTEANNGVYRKVGASGAGSWEKDSDIAYVAQALTVDRIAVLREADWLDGRVLSGDLSSGSGWSAAKVALARAIRHVRIEGATAGEQYFLAIFQNNETGNDIIAVYSSSGTPAIQAAIEQVIAKSDSGVTKVVVTPSDFATQPGLTVTLWIDYRELDGVTGAIVNSSTPGPLWLAQDSEAARTDRRLAELEAPAWTGYVDVDGDLSVISANPVGDGLSPAVPDPIKAAVSEGAITGIEQAGPVIRWVDRGSSPVLRRLDTEGLRNLPATVERIVFLPALGQSLLTGTGGYAAGPSTLTTLPTHAGRSWMFNGGSRVIQGLTWENSSIRQIDDAQLLELEELYEALPSNALNYGETQGGGISWWMGKSGVMDADTVLAFATFAFGGTGIASLSPGTVPYGNVIRAVERLQALCAMAGITLEVPALFWDQGEADVDAATTASAYRDALTTLQAAFTTDVAALTGTAGERPLLIRQPSSFTKYGEARDPLMYAFVDHAIANPTKFKLAGPQYNNPGYLADGVHMTRGGYRLEGEYVGRALERLRDGVATGGLYATTAANSGTTVTLTFNAESQLVLDTTLVSDPGQNGLTLVGPDGTTTIGLSSIAVSGTDKITATAGSALTPGQTYTVEIAGRGTATANAGPTTGARSNIRDSATDDTSAALQGELATATKLYNWAHHQRISFVAA